jgi:hypothetical protein
VEILWMDGENPVDGATPKFFFDAALREFACGELCERFRTSLRLIRARTSIQFLSLLLPKTTFSTTSVSPDVHRFEQSIAGRPYLIEVAAVAKDRWRAYIVRVPGVPTALMPFYGRTPDEAAQLLSAWLTRAYERAAAPAGSV